MLKNNIIRKLGAYSVRKGGDEFIFTCCWCRRKKLEVNFKKGKYNCFFCKEGGTVSFLAKRLKLSCVVASPIDRQRLGNSEPEEIKIPGYELAKEGALNWTTGLSQYIKSRGVSLTRAYEMKWGVSSDLKFARRLIIPIIEKGRIVCYVARSMYGEEPKEICPPSSVCNRSHFLYNLDSIEPGDSVVIVEGIFGCEAVVSRGYKCVASMGSNLSDIQIGKLLAKKPRAINIMFDGDEAGRKGEAKAYLKIIGRFNSGVYMARIPDGFQPDGLSNPVWQNLRLI